MTPLLALASAWLWLAASVPGSGDVQHEVRPGETLSHLADRYGTSVSLIKAANGIRNPRSLRAGARLTIPLTAGAVTARTAGPREVDPASGKAIYSVRRGDSAYLIARTHRVSLNELLAWNGLTRLRKGMKYQPTAQPGVNSNEWSWKTRILRAAQIFHRHQSTTVVM